MIHRYNMNFVRLKLMRRGSNGYTREQSNTTPSCNCLNGNYIIIQKTLSIEVVTISLNSTGINFSILARALKNLRVKIAA